MDFWGLEVLALTFVKEARVGKLGRHALKQFARIYLGNFLIEIVLPALQAGNSSQHSTDYREAKQRAGCEVASNTDLVPL